jgi:hypothetical protein
MFTAHIFCTPPQIICGPLNSQLINDDNDTVIALNVSYPKSFKSCALRHFLTSPYFAGALLALKTGNSIADSGATQIFIMNGTPVINKRVTTNSLTVSLADGRQVLLTHMCDIHIKGLPFPLSRTHYPQTFHGTFIWHTCFDWSGM